VGRLSHGRWLAMGTSGLRGEEMRAVLHAVTRSSASGVAVASFVEQLRHKIEALPPSPPPPPPPQPPPPPPPQPQLPPPPPQPQPLTTAAAPTGAGQPLDAWGAYCMCASQPPQTSMPPPSQPPPPALLAPPRPSPSRLSSMPPPLPRSSPASSPGPGAAGGSGARSCSSAMLEAIRANPRGRLRAVAKSKPLP
ncbi:hypothetical protein EMIHUDRAFT_374337, partial [Emiliania huxleyi CCMP1516]|uniref:WH2 domain-containing protein n=2 Tax=Emiliania huxleyi TaxID=2903 RepID=A0A0D3II88_EMIH1